MHANSLFDFPAYAYVASVSMISGQRLYYIFYFFKLIHPHLEKRG
ncbi:hypothetical protein T4B_2571 [Trichinella pseudospiralis]|uniref:Uncharacterized protein n=1 Tax=Trichinella pseudospiralis TaxID=6337 RepID=A0A0V1GEC2_TRIPS|nr:hypothetical protein T4B_2571 [Trichinella pseudospiralis]